MRYLTTLLYVDSYVIQGLSKDNLTVVSCIPIVLLIITKPQKANKYPHLVPGSRRV